MDNEENMMNTKEINEMDEYLTVAQLSQRYPAFSEGSIRWLIFNEKINGFSKVVRRIGRKVVIRLSAWKEFLEEQTQL